jgi:hypothetical protein
MDDDFKVMVATTLGRIEQKVDGLNVWMTKHVEDDKCMADDIRALQMSSARRKGAIWGISTVGSFVGAGIGYAVELLTRGHH